MIHMAQSRGLPARMMEAVDAVNEAQKDVLFRKIHRHFGGELKDKTDRRLGPGLQAADRRHPRGPRPGPDRRAARRRGRTSGSTTPRRWPTSAQIYGERLVYCDRPYGALEQADALAIVTEWNEFRNPDFEVMRRLMRQPVIFDGRNVYDPARMAALGFTYHGIGRAASFQDQSG